VLKEDVSWFRWIGTLVIVIGIIIVALDDKQLTGERKIAHGLHEDGSGSQNTHGNCQ
jgi:drug/metabolite transporter (DMT)-like permease